METAVLGIGYFSSRGAVFTASSALSSSSLFCTAASASCDGGAVTDSARERVLVTVCPVLICVVCLSWTVLSSPGGWIAGVSTCLVFAGRHRWLVCGPWRWSGGNTSRPHRQLLHFQLHLKDINLLKTYSTDKLYIYIYIYISFVLNFNMSL
jgi:hypothetical protein